MGPEKIVCYIRYFVISDLFILSFHLYFIQMEPSPFLGTFSSHFLMKLWSTSTSAVHVGASFIKNGHWLNGKKLNILIQTKFYCTDVIFLSVHLNQAINFGVPFNQFFWCTHTRCDTLLCVYVWDLFVLYFSCKQVHVFNLYKYVTFKVPSGLYLAGISDTK